MIKMYIELRSYQEESILKIAKMLEPLIDESDYIMIAVSAKATPDAVKKVREIMVSDNINDKVIFT